MQGVMDTQNCTRILSILVSQGDPSPNLSLVGS